MRPILVPPLRASLRDFRTHPLAAATAAVPVAPGVPTIGTATAGNSQATVAFTPTGAAATGFVVRAASASAAAARNLQSHAQEINGATGSWTSVQLAAATTGAAIAPDGTMTATRIVPNTSSAAHYVDGVLQSGMADNEIFSVSVFAKAAGYSRIRCSAIVKNGSGPTIEANLTTGAITTTGQGTGGSGITFALDALPDGWHRLRVMGVSALTGATVPRLRILCIDDAGLGTYAGDGTSGYFLWGGQLELGAAVTSYQRHDASGTRYHPMEFGSASPIAATGLANGTAYTFTAQALNAAGYSAESSASNSVTPADPSPAYVAKAAGSATSVNVPAGAQPGDVILLAIVSESQDASTPTGFTALNAVNNSSYSMKLFSRVMQAGDASYSYTTSGGGFGAAFALRNLAGTIADAGLAQVSATGIFTHSDAVNAGKGRFAVYLSDGVEATNTFTGGTDAGKNTSGSAGTGFVIQMRYDLGTNSARAATTFTLDVTTNSGAYAIALLSVGLD